MLLERDLKGCSHSNSSNSSASLLRKRTCTITGTHVRLSPHSRTFVFSESALTCYYQSLISVLRPDPAASQSNAIIRHNSEYTRLRTITRRHAKERTGASIILKVLDQCLTRRRHFLASCWARHPTAYPIRPHRITNALPASAPTHHTTTHHETQPY